MGDNKPTPSKKLSSSERSTRRDEIYRFILSYANEHHGPTPTINEIAAAFGLGYTTTYNHVQRLIKEGRLDLRNGKLVVIGSEWKAP